MKQYLINEEQLKFVFQAFNEVPCKDGFRALVVLNQLQEYKEDENKNDKKAKK